MKKVFLMTALVSFAVMAAESAEMTRGPWRLVIGPSWRDRTKSTISGTASVTPIAPSFSVTYDQNIATHGPWTGAEPNIATVADPLTSLPTYAATATRTETTITPNSGIGDLSSSDVRSLMGLKSSVEYDLLDCGSFSFGLSLAFAAYWDMRSSIKSSAGGGTTSVSSFTDYYLFASGPYPVTAPGAGWSFFFPNTTPELPLRTPIAGPTTTPVASTPIRARITSDMYQIGFGPSVAWHPYDWLDAYAKAEALCNLVHMDFEVNGAANSSTSCRLGFGSEIGAVAWLTENLGVYAEVGYEWVDAADTRLGGLKGKTDFSSLVVSSGIMMGF